MRIVINKMAFIVAVPAHTLPAVFSNRHKPDGISLPWLACIATVHAGLIAGLATTGHARLPPLSPPTVTLQVEMIAQSPAAPVRIVEAPAPQPVPVKRDPPPRPKRPLAKPATPAPVPTSTAASDLVAPQAVAAPSAQESADTRPRQEAAPSAAPAPETTQARFDANYLKNPAPAYPAMSRRLGEEGRVVLRVFVDAEGHPGQIELKNSSGFPRLDQSAEDAVRRWKFVPARRGDEAVATWVAVPIVFNLRS